MFSGGNVRSWISLHVRLVVSCKGATHQSQYQPIVIPLPQQTAKISPLPSHFCLIRWDVKMPILCPLPKCQPHRKLVASPPWAKGYPLQFALIQVVALYYSRNPLLIDTQLESPWDKGYPADCKHCQRHNGPEGWVLITSCYTNLDRITSSESRTGILFKISTKHEHLN